MSAAYYPKTAGLGSSAPLNPREAKRMRKWMDVKHPPSSEAWAFSCFLFVLLLALSQLVVLLDQGTHTKRTIHTQLCVGCEFSQMWLNWSEIFLFRITNSVSSPIYLDQKLIVTDRTNQLSCIRWQKIYQYIIYHEGEWGGGAWDFSN